jgi:hypothetical protein
LGTTRFRRNAKRCHRTLVRLLKRMGCAREHTAARTISTTRAEQGQVLAGAAHSRRFAAFHGGDSAVGQVFRAEAAVASAALRRLRVRLRVQRQPPAASRLRPRQPAEARQRRPPSRMHRNAPLSSKTPCTAWNFPIAAPW